jgi:hypothetical protein
VKQVLHSDKMGRLTHGNFAAELSPPNQSRLELCGITGGLYIGEFEADRER